MSLLFGVRPTYPEEGDRSIWCGGGKRGEVPFDLLKERGAAPYLMLLSQACLIWTHLSSHVLASGPNPQKEECVAGREELFCWALRHTRHT
ncbi:hypothetical protein Q8A67_008018 [Cirrhinus molitorella]|uniref:Uncharacterized protein n=1 Tax=Cirrhinus molitorella TaxID=172907 RepID=A0AA88Q3C6_9TELE|nr:hypothetical protein Q8A67_008018 [Cirrhinus molitorella]